MGLERTGARASDTARSSVSTDDTAWPTGAAPDGSVLVPGEARGAITHVTVEAAGTATTVACRVDILGSIGTDWFVLAPLNSGSNLTRTTIVGVADGNNINYAESFSHVSFFDRLYPLISSTAGGASVTVKFHFEKP